MCFVCVLQVRSTEKQRALAIVSGLLKDESQRNRNQIAEIIAVFNKGTRECNALLADIKGDDEEREA